MRIFRAEEVLEEHLRNATKQAMKFGQEILSLQKEIDTLENPRNSSLDNRTVLWCSPLLFKPVIPDKEEKKEDSTESFGSDSVEGIISVIEQAVFTCQRCADPDDAIKSSRDLLANKLLRCVAFGGGREIMAVPEKNAQNHIIMMVFAFIVDMIGSIIIRIIDVTTLQLTKLRHMDHLVLLSEETR